MVIQACEPILQPDSPTIDSYSVLTEDQRTAITVLRRRLLVMSKYVILGILSLYGSCAYTTGQYEHMCAILLIFNIEFNMPSASSLRKVKWPFMTQELFPKSQFIKLQCSKNFHPPQSHNLSTAQLNEAPIPNPSDTQEALIVNVSEWGKCDISNSIFLDELLRNQDLNRQAHGASASKIYSDRTIERSRIVADAHKVSTDCDSLYI